LAQKYFFSPKAGPTLVGGVIVVGRCVLPKRVLIDFGTTAEVGVDPFGVFSSSFLIKINSAITGFPHAAFVRKYTRRQN